jgi:hypothetical protein
MDKTAFFFVLFNFDDICLMLTVAPFKRVVLLVRYAAPFTENEPPVMLIVVFVSIPLTVIVLEVIAVFNGTSVWSIKVNLFGVVSAAKTLKLIKYNQRKRIIKCLGLGIKTPFIRIGK